MQKALIFRQLLFTNGSRLIKSLLISMSQKIIMQMRPFLNIMTQFCAASCTRWKPVSSSMTQWDMYKLFSPCWKNVKALVSVRIPSHAPSALDKPVITRHRIVLVLCFLSSCGLRCSVTSQRFELPSEQGVSLGQCRRCCHGFV